MRGLSGIDDRRLLRRLDTTEEASEFDRSTAANFPTPTPLSPPALVVSLPSVVAVLAPLPLLAVDPVFVSIPATGFWTTAGLCLSKLSRRAGEAWTKKVSNNAFCATDNPATLTVSCCVSRKEPLAPNDAFMSAQATPFSPSAACTRLEKISRRDGVRALCARRSDCCFLATSRASSRILWTESTSVRTKPTLYLEYGRLKHSNLIGQLGES